MKQIKLPLAKRSFDILISLMLIILAIPFFVLFLLFQLIEKIIIPSSRGSLFYKEVRVSGGKEFLFTKLRIFKQSVIDKEREKNKIVHTKPLEKDPRNLTASGKILKNIYMDELPQLGHVLFGQMTLVGPRPTNIENTAYLREKGDFTKDIMPCGITGPFQAVKGREGEIESQKDVDMKYINFVSSNPGWRVVLKDIRILIRTIKTVLEAKGI